MIRRKGITVNGGSAAPRASLVKGSGNARLTFTALVPGAAGNNITIAATQSSGSNVADSVAVVGSTITITLGTTGGTTPKGTIASAIATLLQGNSNVTALVTTTVAPGDGSVAFAAFTTTHLAGGAVNEGTATVGCGNRALIYGVRTWTDDAAPSDLAITATSSVTSNALVSSTAGATGWNLAAATTAKADLTAAQHDFPILIGEDIALDTQTDAENLDVHFDIVYENLEEHIVPFTSAADGSLSASVNFPKALVEAVNVAYGSASAGTFTLANAGRNLYSKSSYNTSGLHLTREAFPTSGYGPIATSGNLVATGSGLGNAKTVTVTLYVRR